MLCCDSLICKGSPKSTRWSGYVLTVSVINWRWFIIIAFTYFNNLFALINIEHAYVSVVYFQSHLSCQPLVSHVPSFRLTMPLLHLLLPEWVEILVCVLLPFP